MKQAHPSPSGTVSKTGISAFLTHKPGLTNLSGTICPRSPVHDRGEGCARTECAGDWLEGVNQTSTSSPLAHTTRPSNQHGERLLCQAAFLVHCHRKLSKTRQDGESTLLQKPNQTEAINSVTHRRTGAGLT